MKILCQTRHIALTMLCAGLGMHSAPAQEPATTAAIDASIRAAAMAPNSDTNHGLPLIAPWSTGKHGYVFLKNTGANGGQSDSGYSPAWQLGHITAGHHALLTFDMPEPGLNRAAVTPAEWEKWISYYQSTIQAAAARKLPIVFLGSQWESLLYTDAAYFGLPPETNPNVVTKDAATGAVTVQKKLSPFGPVGPWQQVGRRWASSDMLRQLQEWYPDPPVVLFLSNNEAPKLRAPDAETDLHYTQAGHAPGHSMDYKRLAIGRGWIERYRALQAAWKDNLTAPAWKSNARFIAYGAFGPSHFGRWGGWNAASMYVDPTAPDVKNPEWRLQPQHKIWDGGMADNYLTSGYTRNSDFQVYSPQLEAMNYEFMLHEVMQEAPNFWFELGTWNGCDQSPVDAKDGTCGKVSEFVPAYTPQRYAGLVQFTMWLLRPRVVRDYRIWSTKRANSQPYYDALTAAVDKVYASPTLQSFWRSSELVANATRAHPYNTLIPAEYQNTRRMYLLTTNHDPAPWTLDKVPGLYTELKVFTMARVRGEAGERQWLVYAFAPKAGATAPLAATVSIPGYKDISIDATVGGSFYLVSEKDGAVKAVS